MITTWKELDDYLTLNPFIDGDITMGGGGLCFVACRKCSDDMQHHLDLILFELAKFKQKGFSYISHPGYYDHTRKGLVLLLSLMYEKRCYQIGIHRHEKTLNQKSK